MERILEKEISRTLNINTLKQILPNYVRVVRYDELTKAKTLKDAMGSHSVLILLFNIHDSKHRVLNQPGHFFCISTKGPEPCVVFSSTGMTPKKELFLTQSDPSLLDRILPKGTVYNNFKFQVGNNSQTCWRWQILFAHLAQFGLKKFQSLFSKPNLHVRSPDMMVTIMTYIMLA